MALTRERKVLLGVLGAGVTALAADRLILGGASGPAEAAASTDAPPAATAPADPTPTVARATVTTAPAGDGTPLAHRLAALDLPGSDRDLFQAPPSWRVPREDAAADPEATRQFFRHHRIDAILVDDGIAVIDGRRVRVGDTIDGFVLVELTATNARFRRTESTRPTNPTSQTQPAPETRR